MWVLQGATWDSQGTRPMSFCPSSPRASFRQALPSPLLQPPPLSLRLLHQTKHHLSGKQLPEAALLEQVPPCPPASSHCHTHPPGVPHTCTHMCVPSTCLALLSSVQDGGHRALFPELDFCSNPATSV